MSARAIEDDGGCARCKCCDTDWVWCSDCGGDGHTEEGELYDQDPRSNDIEDCATCDGAGGWLQCSCDEKGRHLAIVPETQP